MELVPGFTALLQGLSATMTTPTFDSLVTVLTGWVFASKRTVTRMILAAGRRPTSTIRPTIGCSARPAGRWTLWDLPCLTCSRLSWATW